MNSLPVGVPAGTPGDQGKFVEGSSEKPIILDLTIEQYEKLEETPIDFDSDESVVPNVARIFAEGYKQQVDTGRLLHDRLVAALINKKAAQLGQDFEALFSSIRKVTDERDVFSDLAITGGSSNIVRDVTACYGGGEGQVVGRIASCMGMMTPKHLIEIEYFQQDIDYDSYIEDKYNPNRLGETIKVELAENPQETLGRLKIKMVRTKKEKAEENPKLVSEKYYSVKILE